MRTAAASAIIPLVGIHLPKPHRLIAALLLFLLAGTQTACITRSVRSLVFEQEHTKVLLRADARGFSIVPKSYEHPVSIAPVRLAHILSRIDLRRDKENKRVAAVPLDTLFLIAEGASVALGQADANQAVAVQSVRRAKHFGIFERKYLTSMLLYMKQGLLYVQISRSDWEIPRDRREKLPETHVGNFPRRFRLVLDKGMAPADQQTAAVDWRNPIFKKPTRTRVTPTGKVVRRTILMESLEDDTDYGPALTGDVTPEQLRALADLEEARRAGNISESEYSAQRTKILQQGVPAP